MENKKDDRMSPTEFLDKCAWEGGNIHEGLEYGLRAKDLDDSHPEFNAIVKECEEAFLVYIKLIDNANEKLPELIGYEW